MKYLSKADYLSPSVNLYLDKNGQVKTKTKLGGAITIITYTLILSSAIYFIQNFFKYTSPLVNINEETNTFINFTNVNQRVPLIVRLTNEFGSSFKNPEKIYNTAYVWITTKFNNDGDIVQEYNSIPTSPCNSTHFSEENASLFNSIKDLSSYYCVDWEHNKKYDMYGQYGSRDSLYTFGGMVFTQCNTANSDNACLDQKELDKIYTGTYMEFITIDNKFSSFTKNPLFPSLYSYRNIITNTYKSRVWLGIQTINYISDFGIIFEDKQTDISFKMLLYKETTNTLIREAAISGSDQIGIISFQNDSTLLVYNRSFSKAQQLLANIGGIIKGIMIMSEIIYVLFGSKLPILELEKYMSIYRKSQLFNTESTSLNENIKAILKLKEVKEVNDSNKTTKMNNLIGPSNRLQLDQSSKSIINSVNNMLKNKPKLNFYEKYFLLCFCQSNEMKKYKQMKSMIIEDISVSSLLKLHSSFDVMTNLVFKNDEKELFNFLQNNNFSYIDQDKVKRLIDSFGSKIRSDSEERLFQILIDLQK